MKKGKYIICMMFVLIFALTACGIGGSGDDTQSALQTESQDSQKEPEDPVNTEDTETETKSETETQPETESEKETQSQEKDDSKKDDSVKNDDRENLQADEITAKDIPIPADFYPNGIVVVIDAGHQGKGNFNKEPLGPGSSTMKNKVAAGTTGTATGIQEYKLTLQVSLKLRDELKARGYQVLMIRENHNINISNAERAKFANDMNADAFIRVHANGSDDSSVNGALTICQTSANKFNGQYYSACRKLSDCVINSFCDATGAKNRGVWESDTMTGINWCSVPVTIIEMGFMSNPQEDVLMNSADYQERMVQGIANGIDAYFDR